MEVGAMQETAQKQSQQGPRLLDQVCETLRKKHYSYRTEKTYIYWIRYFILFHDKRHPTEMGPPEISLFLTFLAVERKVSASQGMRRHRPASRAPTEGKAAFSIAR
jgi:hypothetical protein